MATTTDNYQLLKPTYAEQADIGVINSNMNIIDEVMHSSQISLADAYDSTKSYAEGDVVMYELLMYKCISPTTGVWDASKWERTTAAETGGEASDLSVKVPEVISTGDKACYVKRAIPTAGALAEGQKIVGATLAWNQLVDTGTTSVTIASGHKYIKYSGGTYTKGTSDGSAVSVSSGDLFFDITQMFGSTIADSLTVEQFSALFPDTSYAYDAGSLQSVNVSAHKAYDSNATEVSSITLDSSKEFRGLYQLVNGELRADGDIYEADGTVTRKYGIVDLGSITWNYNSENNVFGSQLITELSLQTTNITIICPKYTAIAPTDVTGIKNANDKSICQANPPIRDSTFLRIKDTDYNNGNDLQTALSGVYLVYERKTPTTETATPYTNPQIIDADGTEEFVDYKVSQGTRDVAIPVGHESSFYDYTDGTITIPDLPFADGTYALSVTMNNGTPTATLTKLGIEGTVFEVEGGGGESSGGINYSTTEQVIGTWIDGKPLYMRTFDLGSDIQVPYNTFINTTIDAVDKKAIIGAFGIYSTGETFYPLVANINNGIIRLQACRDNQVALVQYVTIKYTKITD